MAAIGDFLPIRHISGNLACPINNLRSFKDIFTKLGEVIKYDKRKAGIVFWTNRKNKMAAMGDFMPIG